MNKDESRERRVNYHLSIFGCQNPHHPGEQIAVSRFTWTCVRGEHRRCHPMGGDKDPALASSGPNSGLQFKRECKIRSMC